jgi:hypothetical protein
MADLTQKKELAEEAKAVLEDKAFVGAVEKIRARLVGELMTAAAPERQLAVVAKLQALVAVVAELKSLVNDYNAALRRAA